MTFYLQYYIPNDTFVARLRKTTRCVNMNQLLFPKHFSDLVIEGPLQNCKKWNSEIRYESPEFQEMVMMLKKVSKCVKDLMIQNIYSWDQYTELSRETLPVPLSWPPPGRPQPTVIRGIGRWSEGTFGTDRTACPTGQVPKCEKKNWRLKVHSERTFSIWSI